MPSPMIIFLPVRNGGEYLDTAIRSIVAQTDPDWRLIVLENGSTDDTTAIVTGFADPRIELLPADRPLDIEANWQRILQWLDNQDLGDELVTTIGHDDRLMPEFVSEMRNLAGANPDATLMQAAFEMIDLEGKLIRPCRPIPDRETAHELAAALCWGIRDSYGTGYVFRARDYRAVGGFPAFPKLLYADHLLFIRLTQRGVKCATNAALCQYRLHTGSASNNVTRATLNAYAEGLDRFFHALTSDMPKFAQTERGRNALGCLLGREITNLGRPTVRALLSAENQDRMRRFDALFSSLSPDAPPQNWVGPRRSRYIQKVERLMDIAAVIRLKWRELRTPQRQ